MALQQTLKQTWFPWTGIILLGLLLFSCGAGSSSSGGQDQQWLGLYRGTINRLDGGSTPLIITVTAESRVIIAVDEGIFCPGDVPSTPVDLDGDAFDLNENTQCTQGVFECPTLVTLTGAFFDEDQVSGSGQYALGCPSGVLTQTLSFRAVKQAGG